MTLKKIAAVAALSAGLGLASLGAGAGMAFADPGHGHGHDGWNWDDNDRGDWRGPYYGPAYYGPPQACIQATGPFGFVSGGACI
ncbi:hypothetical protein H7J51_00865 [Mycobacterium crocinum]|uniref:Sulfur globule protein n=1 Tax=Mycolicibacterium crocinum TaxID=388459 RepID=A0ABY3TKL3_9MYCO|nr:hypothetical protein [Mycolicibacterium crocinum]MCV7213834.1 hypothetical protein [Mycolicibacterium crocinum]ULN41277.1 hypothetical protein MI149_27435 [Mycolicibacterium crocinum]